jgi:hypothetical protein
MLRGWSIFRPVREQQLFQHVPQGWIFSVAKRWFYLVNSTQRAALLARVTGIDRWRAAWFFLVAALLAAVAVEANRFSGPGFSGWINLFLIVMIVGNLASLFYRAVMPYLQWVLLRHILAGAVLASSPPAPAPIGFWESVFAGSRDEARTFSTGWLVFVCVSCGAAGLIYAYEAVTSDKDYLMTALMIWLALDSGGALYLRLRARQSLEPYAR